MGDEKSGGKVKNKKDGTWKLKNAVIDDELAYPCSGNDDVTWHLEDVVVRRRAATEEERCRNGDV